MAKQNASRNCALRIPMMGLLVNYADIGLGNNFEF